MRKLIFISILLIATRAQAQELNLQSLDKLASRSSEKTIIDLDESTMKLASGFLSGNKQDEATAKKVSSDLKAIHVRTFEFKKGGGYSDADLQPVYDQLKAPEWSRIITIKDDEEVGVWLFRKGENATAMAIVVAGSNGLVVVNLVGTIRPEDLSSVGGQFGIPQIKNLKKD